MLAATRAFTRQQRAQHAHGTEDAAAQVADGYAGAHGRLLG
jgi:hypothetical protein